MIQNNFLTVSDKMNISSTAGLCIVIQSMWLYEAEIICLLKI